MSCQPLVASALCEVYTDHMTHTTCILNHAPAWSNQVQSCERTATHEWHRPGKTPIPCCSDALSLRNADVRPIARPMFEVVGVLMVEP